MRHCETEQQLMSQENERIAVRCMTLQCSALQLLQSCDESKRITLLHQERLSCLIFLFIRVNLYLRKD